ncbi:hypothetical protein PybrP1_001276 [[Pythium] brassicae (nom. inval.)]|nr:hypothetical protein PybrP1_001276 [[Pythium] brassicae (nom. inval.)]
MQANPKDDTKVALATPHRRSRTASTNSNSSTHSAREDDFASGATTPSTVSGALAAPQWSRLMPETTDVQARKRIDMSSSGSSADSSDEEDDASPPWQSTSDLPERRLMVQRIITITEKKHSAAAGASAPEQQRSAATLAKRIELSLYSHASSLDEYKNLSTLRRRLQSLVSLSVHEAAATRSSGEHLQLDLSPKRRFPARNLNMASTPEFAIKRRRLAELSSSQIECSGRIFPGIGEDCLRAIFSFLGGREVVACRVLNRFAADFLPSCVERLALHVAQLKQCIESESFGLRKLTNLKALVVHRQAVEERPSSSSNSSSGVLALPIDAPLLAWGCAELCATQENDGEEVVQQLAAALGSGAGPRLRQLHVVSVFSNTSRCNALRALCDALSRGACPQLEDLLLGGSSSMDAGAADVARLLKSGAVPELARLDLRRNYIGEAGLQRLVAALALGGANKLRHLCVGGNILTDKCVAPLTELLAGGACPQLRFLGLEDNFLSPAGVQQIITAAAANGKAPMLHQVSCESATQSQR